MSMIKSAANLLQSRFTRPQGHRCATLDISIIIPTLNEEEYLPATLERAISTGAREIIVVDGGSADHTLAVAREAGVRTIRTGASRGGQLNAGAAVARSPLLLFLHADTLLPEDAGSSVVKTLEDPRIIAGAFRLQIDADGRAYRMIERCVALRSRWRGLPFGDQAIFMRSRDYHALGGLPDIPVMEDVVFMRRVRRRGKVVLLDDPVITSARRWHRRGVIRTTLDNQVCIIGYAVGIPPHRIDHWRRRSAR